jgi:hypothetical protein
MTGMKRNLKQNLEIAETSSDPRIKLEARRIANDCYKYIMDMVSNSTIINDSLKYIQSKMDHLDAAEKKVLQDTKQDFDSLPQSEPELEDGKEQGQKTTNGVF